LEHILGKNELKHLMSDLEFEVIDNLYFVQRFEALIKEVEIDEKIMQKILEADVWTKNYSNYFYLATKKGLLAHNTK
jgi:hypothetical protein